MDAKLKINIGDDHLEIEGSEAFVQQAYSEFKALVAAKLGQPAADNHGGRTSGANPDKKAPQTPKKSKTAKPGKGFTRLNLNLRPAGKVSLRDFVGQFDSPTKDELYLLSISYLIDHLHVKNITIDHIYTCLDELDERIPTHLRQVLTNTKNDKGWIDTSDFENLTTTIKGQNHLKHDMIRAGVKA